jgi:hypothetical protein
MQCACWKISELGKRLRRVQPNFGVVEARLPQVCGWHAPIAALEFAGVAIPCRPHQAGSPARLIDHLNREVSPSSVAGDTTALYDCARILLPELNWAWLRALISRCIALPRRKCESARYISCRAKAHFPTRVYSRCLIA